MAHTLILLKKFFLYCASGTLLAVVTLVLLFTVLDVNPRWHQYLAKAGLRYYQLNELYAYDATRGVVMRPNRKDNGLLVAPDLLHHPVLSPFHSNSKFFSSYDENGFRPNSSTGDADIVFIGDSFFQCGERDDNTLSELIARQFKVKTINLGVAWHGPAQYLINLREFGLKRHPKAVILGFFEGNDLRDIKAFEALKQGHPYYHFTLQEPSFLRRLWLSAIDVVGALTNFLKHTVRIPIAQALGRYGGGIVEQTADVRINDQHYKFLFTYAADARSPAELLASQELQLLEQYVGDFQRLASDHNFYPLFVFIPTANSVYADLSNESSGSHWNARRAQEVARNDNRRLAIQELAAKLRIPYLDLTETFRQEAAQGKLLYYPFDSHWNEEGRSIAANSIAQALQSELKMLPASR